jgi:hypothetical protein
MKQFLLAFLLAAPALAFIPPTAPIKSPPSKTQCNVWKKSVQDRRRAASGENKKKYPKGLVEFAGDPESDEFKMHVSVLGYNRIKRGARKAKREKNQMIRLGLIELNEEGRWVTTDPEERKRRLMEENRMRQKKKN